MFGLIAAYGSGEDTDSDTDADEETKKPTEPPEKVPLPKPFELPSPNLDSKQSDTKVNEKSVFVNPYLEADNAKTAILEKHVKMISTDVITVNGRKVCWNNIKKKCRFGHRCKYAHISDIQLPEGSQAPPPPEPKETVYQSSSIIRKEVVMYDEETGRSGVKKGTKRPGLSQTLVPGKKVLKFYNKAK